MKWEFFSGRSKTDGDIGVAGIIEKSEILSQVTVRFQTCGRVAYPAGDTSCPESSSIVCSKRLNLVKVDMFWLF